MYLIAKVVDWEAAKKLKNEDGFAETMYPDNAENILFDDPPEPADSCMLYQDVARVLGMAGSADLSDRVDEALGDIMSQLVNTDFLFPADLGEDVNPEVVAGAFSPERTGELLQSFAQLDRDEFAAALREPSVIDLLRMEEMDDDEAEEDDDSHVEVFLEYLQDWEDLFRFAHDKGAGVVLQMG